MSRTERLKEQVLQAKGLFLDRKYFWTESYKVTDGIQYELRQAKAFAYLLENMTIEIGSYELIVGKYPKRLQTEEDKQWLEEAKKFWEERPGLIGITRQRVINTEKVLSIGIGGILEEVMSELLNLDDSPLTRGKRDFYTAAQIVLLAASQFFKRYAKGAEIQAIRTKDPVRRAELKTISHMCNHISLYPPNTFWEAVQLTWFIYLLLAVENCDGGACSSLGRVDNYLYRFYKSDLDGGFLAKEKARELLTCLFIKFNEFDTEELPQIITIGGQSFDGADETNDLTLICLDICKELQMHQPIIAIRWHKGITKELVLKVAEILQTGIGFPILFNDEIIVSAELEAGLPIEFAKNYIPCSYLEILPGNCTNLWFIPNFINSLQALFLALNNGIDPLTKRDLGARTGDVINFNIFDNLKEAFFRQIDHFVEKGVEKINSWQERRRSYAPLPFLSCFVEDCIEKGLDITAGGARFNFVEPELIGITNTAGLLAVIRKMVFENNEISMIRLQNILCSDSKERLVLRQRMKEMISVCEPSQVLDLMAEITCHFRSELAKYTSPIGAKYFSGILFSIMDSLLQRGEHPNLRLNPEIEDLVEFRSEWMWKPSAVIKSPAKFDLSKDLGGLVIDLKSELTSFANPDGIEKFYKLVQACFSIED